MGTKYYNKKDELVRKTPKNRIVFENPNEKYGVIVNQDPVQNEDYSEENAVNFEKGEIQKQIETKTEELIAEGYTHSDNNKYSLDDASQNMWNSVMNRSTPPFEVFNVEYQMVSYETKEELQAAYDGGYDAKINILKTQGNLLKQLSVAKTYEELTTIKCWKWVED
jgi:hypothetical protein